MPAAASNLAKRCDSCIELSARRNFLRDAILSQVDALSMINKSYFSRCK